VLVVLRAATLTPCAVPLPFDKLRHFADLRRVGLVNGIIPQTAPGSKRLYGCVLFWNRLKQELRGTRPAGAWPAWTPMQLAAGGPGQTWEICDDMRRHLETVDGGPFGRSPYDVRVEPGLLRPGEQVVVSPRSTAAQGRAACRRSLEARDVFPWKPNAARV